MLAERVRRSDHDLAKKGQPAPNVMTAARAAWTPPEMGSGNRGTIENTISGRLSVTATSRRHRAP